MTYARRPFLPAVVGPLASLVIDRQLGPQLEEYARRMERSPHEQNRDAAREVFVALASMRECARQLRERDRVGSAGGTSEPAEPAPGAGSAHLLDGGSGLTVQVVAERFRVSPEFVRRLCRSQDDGGLSATKQGRDWVIDAASVAAYEAARRPVA